MPPTITRARIQRRPDGVAVSGLIAGCRFEALIVPPDSLDPIFLLHFDRIARLRIEREGNGSLVFEFDHGFRKYAPVADEAIVEALVAAAPQWATWAK